MCKGGCKCREAAPTVVRLHVGDVVRALAVVVDVDPHGTPYIHAVPGTYGVIISDEEPTFPNVAWDVAGKGGVCNVPASILEMASGTVFRVCG